MILLYCRPFLLAAGNAYPRKHPAGQETNYAVRSFGERSFDMCCLKSIKNTSKKST